MKETTGSLTAANGQSIEYRRWEADGETRAVLLVVHGMAEHCGRYERLARRVTADGIAVSALDLPGHGLSGGEKGHVDRFEDYLSAVAQMRDLQAQWYPDLPVFLLGHSMGGLVATATLVRQQHDYAGCVLSGPALRSPLTPPFAQLLMVKLLSFLLPRTKVLGLDPAGVSRDPAIVKDYIDDPLNHGGKISARMIAELFGTMEATRAAMHGIEIPLLILHGGADSMTAPEGARELHAAAASADKTLEIYDGLYHEIFNEPEGPQIIDDVAKWLVARMPHATA